MALERGGSWKKGTCLNPAGRPKGAKNKISRFINQIGDRGAEILLKADEQFGGDKGWEKWWRFHEKDYRRVMMDIIRDVLREQAKRHELAVNLSADGKFTIEVVKFAKNESPDPKPVDTPTGPDAPVVLP